MENETYFKLESNDGKGYIIAKDLNAIKDMIETDVSDIHPLEVGEVVYTITPIRMTEEAYRNLPENDDW